MKSRNGDPARPPYNGQFDQDRILREELFGDRRGGVFVDIGAHDGVTFSNTLFFERELGWTGLCVEPVPETFELLARNRAAVCVQACVAREAGNRSFLRVSGYAEMLSGLVDSYDSRHMQRIEDEVREYGGSTEMIQVRAAPLETLLGQHGIGAIDLLCVDVEGAELDVLSFFERSAVRPSVVCIENNYSDARIWHLLRGEGYRPYARIGPDEIYLSREFVPQPRAGRT